MPRRLRRGRDMRQAPHSLLCRVCSPGGTASIRMIDGRLTGDGKRPGPCCSARRLGLQWQ